MNDPYVTLGVSRDASDEEVKKAYRELARKYHPDNYANNPLADLAQEKMKEINEAYDAIGRERAGNGGTQAQYAGYQPGAGRSGHSTGAYGDARAAINSGDLDRAEMILGSITERNAEWNFLMGSLAYRRGWMDEAARYFRFANAMDPSNPEYRQALTYMQNASQNPFVQRSGSTGNVDACSVCGNLMVADCCCEMMGGDLIPCC